MAALTYIGMSVCCHWCMPNFVGRMMLDFDSGSTTLRVLGSRVPWDPGQLTLRVEGRYTPWYDWYLRMFPDYMRAEMTATDSWAWKIDGLDCLRWTIRLPWIPADIPINWMCNYRPLHIIVYQQDSELGRFTVQRRQHCIHVNHTSGVLRAGQCQS